MTGSFGEPQRQSPIGIVVMFTDTAREYGKAMWPLIIIAFIQYADYKPYLIIALIGFLTFLALAAYLRYRNFTFYIDDENEEFIITNGIFSKTRTAIRLDRIQQVNINQSLIQKIIGVYELEVDTPGSNSKEGKIRAVSHPLAIELKSRLLTNPRKSDAVTADETDQSDSGQAFIKISFASLVKTGITSNYVRTTAILLTFIITMWDNFRQLSQVEEANGIGQYINYDAIMQSIITVMLLFAVAVLVINLIRVIVKYFNFTVNRQHESLLLTYGLFNTKSTILRPKHVQITAVTRNYFQRKMDILQIRIKQAAGSDELEKSAIDIPGCNAMERDQILSLLYGTMPEPQIVLRPNYRKLLVAILISIVLPLSVFFIVGKFAPGVYDFAYVAVLYVISVSLLVIFGFRNNRLYVSEKFIVHQSGAWDVTRAIIETGKIQAITTSQYFWHKSLDIGSITLHTAGGSIDFLLGNFTVIKQYANLWLYKIESTDSNWM